ncbi:MAG: RNA methyltransferase [Hyphomonadaceae bacterium]|nr:RNA methyltransferase [Hyphomonadaceae bacterium]
MRRGAYKFRTRPPAVRFKENGFQPGELTLADGCAMWRGMSCSPPCIILHRPQLGENIGSAARVMLNFGLTEMRLVEPRDGWPNPAAGPLSAGALDAGVSVESFETVEAALADLELVLATTARPRGMEKPVVDAAQGVEMIKSRGLKTGILFGAENHGLPSEIVGLADAILTYPVNPEFASLNLAQAVGVLCASWGASQGAVGRWQGEKAGVDVPAPREDLIRMFEHLEDELERAGYFYPADKTPLMKTNIRNAFIRGNWTIQEVRTFRGAIKALALGRGKARIQRDD